jgi:hypothetical protein
VAPFRREFGGIAVCHRELCPATSGSVSFFDEALGSAESVEFDASGSTIPACEINRLKRFRSLVRLAFSIDQALYK